MARARDASDWVCAAAYGCAGHLFPPLLYQLKVIEHPGLVDISLRRAIEPKDHKEADGRIGLDPVLLNEVTTVPVRVEIFQIVALI